MTVALSDTQLLTDMLRPLHSFQCPVTTATTTSKFYTARKPVSATINTLANALYQVNSDYRSPQTLALMPICPDSALSVADLCKYDR